MKRQDRETQKNQKINKTILAEKQKEDGIVYNDNGKLLCAVPLVSCSKPCDSLPQSLEEGIKMECTNPSCIFIKHLLHPQCFEAMELQLLDINVKKSTTHGWSGWSKNHKKHMLWTSKSLKIIQRSLKCPCGKGVMNRDEDAWNEREKLLEPPEEKPKKKHAKTNNLPLIAINSSVDKKKAKELENHFLSSHMHKNDEIDIENKYGPINAPAGSIRKRRTIDSSVASSTRSISKPPSVPSTPIYSKPSFVVPLPPTPTIRKIPIGLNPIKSPPKLTLENSEEIKRLPPATTTTPPTKSVSSWKIVSSHLSKTSSSSHPSSNDSKEALSTTTGNQDTEEFPPLSCPKTTKLLNLKIDTISPSLSQPSQTSNQSKEGSSITQPSDIETTITNSVPIPTTPVVDQHEIITSKLKNSKDASTQTDLTIFYQNPSMFKETWIKVYSPIYFENGDSGIHSTIDSPSFLQQETNVTQQQQPLSSASSKTASMMDGECLGNENNGKILTNQPPPGFDNFYDDKSRESLASVKDVKTADEVENTNNYVNLFPLEESPVSLSSEYSFFIIEQYKSGKADGGILGHIEIQNIPIWRDPIKQNYFNSYIFK